MWQDVMIFCKTTKDKRRHVEIEWLVAMDVPAACCLSHRFFQASINHNHSAVFLQPVGVDVQQHVPSLLLPPTARTDAEKTSPTFISAILPEFPQREFPVQDHFEILNLIAKGSHGHILKIRDVYKEKIVAVKALPKSEILKNGVLEQTKEEVIIQQQLKHPFILKLQDSWQTQHHLFIMFDYCSCGDLYTHWLLKGRFEEDDIRLFSAELGLALGFLHELGIMHRDVKMENVLLSDRGHVRLSDFGLSCRLKRGGRAFTICGTIQYMAPEVLSGGPYQHAADWWSLGVLLFSMVTGEFPVAAESDHISMLKKVRDFPFVLPKTISSALILLLSELLCKNPANRLRSLDCFKMQPFLCSTSFDSYILQKTPVRTILELRTHPDWAARSMRGISPEQLENFDYDQILNSSLTPTVLTET